MRIEVEKKANKNTKIRKYFFGKMEKKKSFVVGIAWMSD